MQPTLLLDFFKTRLAATVFVFVVIQVWLGAMVETGRFDRFAAVHHGFEWWAIKGYKDRPEAPDVVMIGSSLLQHVCAQGEANYLHRSINSLQHNTSQHLADRLSQFTADPVSVHAIAIGGMHCSDAEILTAGLMKDKRPAALVYTIAPRDLMDNALPSPMSTETYQVMNLFVNQPELDRSSKHSAQDKFEYDMQTALERSNPLFSGRRVVRQMFERDWRSVVGAVQQQLPGTAVETEKFGHVKQDFDLSDIHIEPNDPSDKLQLDNHACYTCTYQPFYPRSYANQLSYLKTMLTFAKSHGIQPILVNMPLREDNFALMPANFYSLYMKDLRTVASATGSQLVDLQTAGIFTSDDYIDSVHLKGDGAIKCVDALADRLAPRLSAYVEHRRDAAGKQLASKGAVVY